MVKIQKFSFNFLLSVTVLLVLLTGTSYSVSESDGKIYSIERLEERMLENNSRIRSSSQTVNSLRNRLDEAGYLHGPELKFSYSYFPGGSVGGLFANDVDQLADTTINYPIVQSIFEVPKLKDERRADLNVAKAEMDHAVNSAMFELRKLYFETLIEKARSEEAYRNLTVLKDIRDLVERRKSSGEALLPEVIDVQEKIHSSSKSYIRHLSLYNNKKDIIASMTGLESKLIKLDDEWKDMEIDTNLEHLVSKAFDNNPELKIPMYKSKAAGARAERASYQHLGLNTQAGYVVADNPGGVEQGIWFRLEFSIPLFYFQLKEKTEDTYFNEKLSWQDKAKLTKTELEQDIQTTYGKLMEIQAAISSTEIRIEKSVENLRIKKSIIDYPTQASPEVTKIDLLEEKIHLNELKTQLTVNKLKRNIIIYHILYHTGVEEPYKLSSGGYQTEPPGKTEISNNKAIWIWDTSFLGDIEKERAVLNHLKSNGITKAFVSFNRELINTLPDNQNLADFISMLNGNGIRAQALLGEHTWIYPDIRIDIITIVSKIVDYNNMFVEDSRFNAIHLDIEPHATKEWTDNEKEYLSLLVDTYEEVDSLLIKKAPEIELWVDIPDWYDRVDVNMLRDIFSIADQVVLMAYGKLDYEWLLKAVREELVIGESYGKGVWIGLESKDFIENDLDINDMEILQQNIIDNVSFSIEGFAIHDFTHHKQLIEKSGEVYNNPTIQTNNSPAGHLELTESDNSDSKIKNDYTELNNLFAGSFTVQQNALELSNSLNEKGYDSSVEMVKIDGDIYYRVSVGKFPTKTLAEVRIEEIKSNNNLNTSFFIIEEK